jgi:hypothetical protein
MKLSIIFRIVTAFGIVAGLMATVPTSRSLAACEGEGTTEVNCTAAGSPYTDVVDGSAGTDTITIESGAVVDVANGAAIDTHGGDDQITIETGAIVESSDNTAEHVGITNSGDANNVNNAGLITASGNGEFANYGIQNIGGDNNINNSGAITVSGDSYGNLGIANENTGNTNVNNSGTISATGNASNVGINAYGAETVNTVINSGTITATGSGQYAYNTGIHTQYGGLYLENSGNIIASGSDLSNVGVNMYSGTEITIINSGQISVTGGDGENATQNTGVNASANIQGTVINSGDIIVTGSNATNTGVVLNSQYAGDTGEVSFDYYNSGNILITGDTQNIGLAAYGGPNTIATVTNAGQIIVSGGDSDYAIITGGGADTVTLANGSLTSSDVAVATFNGDDTVILGNAGVSYSQQCGDMTVVQANNDAPVVNGLMDGGNDNDTLVFSFVTANGNEATNLDSYIASLGGSNTATINGQSYDFANFENVHLSAIVYQEGDTKLFDDGVVIAFAQAGGIAVCSGEAGLRAGTIDYAALEAGQTTFSLNGWSVVVSPMGNGQYVVRLFDSAGQEHFNDANSDGVADSQFVFQH